MSHRRSLSLGLLVFALGCGGKAGTASSGGDGNPETADASATGFGNGSGSGSTSASSGSSSGSTRSGSSGAIAPCVPAIIEAGTAPVGDAEVPLNHRAAPACCPTQRGPAPPGQPYPHCTGPAGTICPSDMATTCSSDSECTAGVNGRCFPWQGLVGPGGCSYDECFTDSNCGSKTPCLCRSSSTDNSANSCDVGGNCAVDSDCGPGGYCSPSPQMFPNPNVCWGSQPYYCHTASDLCINDSDCAPLDAGPPAPLGPRYTCAYDPQDNRWECAMAVCALP
jgi:hypothetical protein